MGKSAKKNIAKDRATPIAKPVKPPADPELAALREKKILPVINDLTSPETSKRSAAANAIANLIEDRKTRKLLLREQVVRILLEQTITDSSLESKSAGWGVLRNLALEEEADFSVHLYRQDILTPVTAIISMIFETIESKETPIAKLPKAQHSLLWTLSTSVVGLVQSLAEAQEDILEAISRMPTILAFLFGLLNVPDLPAELFSEILSCLATLTEDNTVLAQQIVEREAWLKGLMQLREQGASRAVAACAVLHNVFTAVEWFDHNTPMPGASDAMLIPTLVHYMSEAAEEKTSSDNLDPDQILKMALEITASIATSLQEALEHASKPENEKGFEGFSDKDEEGDDVMGDDAEDDASEGEDVDENEEKGSDEDEMTLEEMQADMDRVIGDNSDSEDEGDDVSRTLDAIVRVATPFILTLTKSKDESVAACAVSALNNIAWSISSIDFSTASTRLTKNWIPLAQKIWGEAVTPVLASNTADIELASSVTSLAWAIGRSVQGKINIASDEAKRFMALYQASKNLPVDPETDAFQGLGVKCIGVLGRLAQNQDNLAQNREIGIFILTVLAALPETKVADVVQALDEIFDIYGDKSYPCDEIFWKDGFYKHLEELKVKVNKASKTIDKRKDTELRNRADEAHLNLIRFLSYKKKEQRQR